MNYKNNFEKREFLGRKILQEIQQMYPNIFKTEIVFTENKYDHYDAYYHTLKKNKLKTTLIEIKIRDKEFDNYILQKDKIDNIKKEIENSDLKNINTKILYMNILPTKVYFFDITNLNKQVHKLKTNKATSISREEKIEKEVYYLEPSEASLTIDYIYDENRLTRMYYEEFKNNLINNKLKNNHQLLDVFYN